MTYGKWKYQIIDGHGIRFTDSVEYESLEQAKVAMLNNWDNIYHPETANVFSQIDENHTDGWGFNFESHRGEWHHQGIRVNYTRRSVQWMFGFCSVMVGICLGQIAWERTHDLGYGLIIALSTTAAVAIPCFVFEYRSCGKIIRSY
jgi:hypothetical protein